MRVFFRFIWYFFRLVRQTLNMLYIRTIGSCSYRYVGVNTVFDGIPDIVVPYSNIFVGSNSRIGKNCVIYTSFSAKVKIGNHVSINNNVHITAESLIEIGDYSLIAEGVGIRDHDHRFSRIDVPIRDQSYNSRRISIHRNVWIGRNATILKGVTIGEGAIVGANAVVTKDIEPYSINVGNPSRLLKYR